MRSMHEAQISVLFFYVQHLIHQTSPKPEVSSDAAFKQYEEQLLKNLVQAYKFLFIHNKYEIIASKQAIPLFLLVNQSSDPLITYEIQWNINEQ